MISPHDEIVHIQPKWSIWTNYFRILEEEEARSSAASLSAMTSASSLASSFQSVARPSFSSKLLTPVINLEANSSNRSSSSNIIPQPVPFSTLSPMAMVVDHHRQNVIDKKDQVPSMTWEELLPSILPKLQELISTCSPYIKAFHFDGGVRYWLLKVASLNSNKKQGVKDALNALHVLQQATNLSSVRSMRAFLTTRLIDVYEQAVFQQDPEQYARFFLTPEQFQLISTVVKSGEVGLEYIHFDPKVLATIKDLSGTEGHGLSYVKTRLGCLTAKDLLTVRSVSAYIYTMLSKGGKTAKQAAADKAEMEHQVSAYGWAHPPPLRRPSLHGQAFYQPPPPPPPPPRDTKRSTSEGGSVPGSCTLRAPYYL